MPSLTTTQETLQADGPILEVHFLIPSELENKYKAEGQAIPPPIVVKALIDTGATSCVVQQSIPSKLGLKPVGVANISTPSCNNHQCYCYYMRMVIPGQNLVYEGVFIAPPLQGQNIECLIGRDLLAHGILIYIGYANQFTLSLL